MRGTTKRRIKSKRSHLADLLSRKDVKEGLDRKPTTIVLIKAETIYKERSRAKKQDTEVH